MSVVTWTSTGPAACAGTTTISVSTDLIAAIAAGTPPKVTAVPIRTASSAKSCPVIVTKLPGSVGPLAGLTPVITGAARVAMPMDVPQEAVVDRPGVSTPTMMSYGLSGSTAADE